MDPILEEQSYQEDEVVIPVQQSECKKGQNGHKRSDVWAHYDERNDGNVECIYCKQVYKYHSKNIGTSTLRNHIEVLCKKYPYRFQDKKQKTLQFYDKNKNVDVLASVGNCGQALKFTQKGVREQVTKYFIRSELPFEHIEDEGFQMYTRYFFPTFIFPSRVTVDKDIYNLFLDEKKKLKKELSKHRVCLTTDCWTSIQNISYMCLTAHWVDDDWRLQKRIISFIQVPSHKGDMVGKELISCLHDWGIDKIFCVTVDNASSNDVAIMTLESCFRDKNNGLVLGGEMLHMRCCAHILNLIVRDGLKEVNHAISTIRKAVRYVRSSPARLKTFRESCKDVNIVSRALLCLDVTTRWNSTYMMLQAALKFRKAFDALKSDANYTNYFKEDKSDDSTEDTINGAPTYVDWDKAEILVGILKTFYDVTLKIRGSLYVTSNTFFQEICEIHGELKELAKEPSTLTGCMAVRMKKKIDKYWGNHEKFNQMLFIATILDPRCKLELLKVGFELMYDVKTATMSLNKVENTLQRLYAWYKDTINPSSASSNVATQFSSQNQSQNAIDTTKSIPTIFKAKLMREAQVEKNDLVDYLNDRCEHFSDGPFDILNWWKLNGHKYKIVSLIAKDVLAVQISTVASESAFSTGGRIFDSFRSSLSAKMVEALICAKNWLQSNKEPIVLRQYLDEVEAFDDSEKALEESQSCVTTGNIEPININ